MNLPNIQLSQVLSRFPYGISRSFAGKDSCSNLEMSPHWDSWHLDSQLHLRAEVLGACGERCI